MPGIFPSIAEGGITVTSVPAVGVANAYVPPAGFTVSCPQLFYGTDCNQNRFASQAFNALVSELLALAAVINPTGAWDCSGTENLANAFTAWSASRISKFMDEPELTDPLPLPTGKSINARFMEEPLLP